MLEENGGNGNYESCGNMGSFSGFNTVGRFAKTRLVSTRSEHKVRSGMPKTAVNYYNMRKGLYLKNGGRGMSASRQKPRVAMT